jgi:hypothetical protein
MTEVTAAGLKAIEERLLYSEYGVPARGGGIEWYAEEALPPAGRQAGAEAPDPAGAHARLIRYRIRHHPNDWPESYAVAEVWSADTLEWHEVVTYQPAQWVADRDGVNGGSPWLDCLYQSGNEPPRPVQLTGGMVTAMTILRERAARILANAQ